MLTGVGFSQPAASRALVWSNFGGVAGAIIGALMDMAAADKHVVYAATARPVPTLTPTRAGGTLTVRW